MMVYILCVGTFRKWWSISWRSVPLLNSWPNPTDPRCLLSQYTHNVQIRHYVLFANVVRESIYYLSFPAFRQLHMFQQLMQTAPELLEALGLRPGSLQQEIANMEKMDKLKVDTLFYPLSFYYCSYLNLISNCFCEHCYHV